MTRIALLRRFAHFYALLPLFCTFCSSGLNNGHFCPLLHIYSRNRARFTAQNTVSCRPEPATLSLLHTFVTFAESTLFAGRNLRLFNPDSIQGSTRHLASQNYTFILEYSAKVTKVTQEYTLLKRNMAKGVSRTQ